MLSSAVVDASSQGWREIWELDPAFTFLNHGSFGACPLAVQQNQQALRRQLEAQPVQFFGRSLEPLLDESRAVLAAFVGASPADLAFVPNATTGVNTVLRSLSFRPGDELLTTNHEYNASRNALDFVAQQSGATVVVADIPFPLTSPSQVVQSVLSRVSDRTRLLLIDHVTSQTALVLPISPLIQALANQGIDTLIDGAHAPGMVPLHLGELGAAYYTGNCHKWLCAPKGAAFLYVREDRRDRIRPLVISHGANSPRRDRSFFHLEFDWTGTGDPTPFLCVGAAIQHLAALLPGGWADIMAQNRALALWAREMLSQRLGLGLPCPDAMIGSMATLLLPEGDADSLYRVLVEDHAIEIPVIPWRGASNRLIRLSAQLYNTPADYDRLADVLALLLAKSQ
ncbi:aminotransferase class V-fold PLP-dependent enzyme [Thermoleptolyngbya sp. C42_A2020_037]|uniref:aminotransferase class V-fold PLP-dependent enzyme n=1 Tax=Thermoleptolyngbya sp. C42_A2020_037 TaxID=2747799 RepID=UPI0019F885CD|nr:aminotransferase class V-fold PLP-dependent enzyme [Thermoleptolyngbya sp. C42_A2020_037]MBF2084257.1 aminotransferase class V-fold PLP-dependent enzyme [Thermoleptolyngbya sp. C42_A2020_037]